MSKPFVTCCPHCNSRFQVTTDQLSAAEGLVRCGHCKEVFNARDSLESAPVIEPKETDIPREPLRLDEKKARRGRYWLWGPLAFIALAGLALQVLWFERHRLAETPALAPLYQQLCSELPCELRGRRDLLRIQSEGLVIRDHSQYRNALEVNLVMINRAPFAQPFPALELVFSALDGTPVAGRRFAPETYLRGELNGQSRMPSNRPIRVKLELLEPGLRAPNYQLRFVAADTP